MHISKKLRESIKNKFGGKCAYCGVILDKSFHVDHIEPIHREFEFVKKGKYYITKTTGALTNPERDNIDNLNPSCRPCNLFKSSGSLDIFREQIKAQVNRCRVSSTNFRTAERFGLVKEVVKPVVFWFEEYNKINFGNEEL